MRLYHNMMSLNVYRNYTKELAGQSKSIGRISTGQKINSAKDAPNKIGQSELLRIQIRGLGAAQKNLQDGTSMMQTVDGALDTVSNDLIRMKELVIQSGSAVNSKGDKEAIQEEINQLKGNIDTTAKNMEFNGVKLLDNRNVSNNNYPETFKMASGANAGEVIHIPMYNLNTGFLADKKGNSIKNIDVVNNNTDSSITCIDENLNMVNNIRSKYGALEQRFTTATENIASTTTMLERSDSNLRDADVALEMLNLSKSSILVEASNAMMAQSNRFPQDVLRILDRMK